MGNYGLYRDDGLGVINGTAREIDNTKKNICALFKDIGLKITIEANLKVVNFLDVTINLDSNTYKPYMKPNNNRTYVHKSSNHPLLILNNIPVSINKRLSNISSNQETFNTTKRTYQLALNNSGYNHQLEYKAAANRNETYKRRRTRNITWFNPPYSKNVATNIGRTFFNILEAEFPKDSKLNKIFNRNTIKLSYSCMPNIASIINKHNKKLLRQAAPNNNTNNSRKCNCRVKANCPMKGHCLESNIIYQATVTNTTNNKRETYIGLTGTDFKTRYNNHMHSFRHVRNKNATELSKYVWKLKDDNINYNIDWKIISKAATNYNSKNTCNLCIKEKYYIIYCNHMASLNERQGIISTCRHMSKYMLNSSG